MYIKEIPKWKPLYERLVDEVIDDKAEEHRNRFIHNQKNLGVCHRVTTTYIYIFFFLLL